MPPVILTFTHGIGGLDQCNQIRKTNKRHINQDALDYAVVHKN